MVLRFRSDVIDQIGWYVYRLIDPRDGKTFYVGKGQGNRVFQHMRGVDVTSDDDLMPPKLETIADILDADLSVKHVIHRHGLKNEDCAYEVEAALIDASDSLTNIQGGHGSGDRGPMTVEDIVERYTLQEAKIAHRLIIIDVSRSFGRKRSFRDSLYDAVRFMWRLKMTRAMKAEFILAQREGVIKGVFKPEKWLLATEKNFPEFAESVRRMKARGGPTRIGFVGSAVTDFAIVNRYVNKRVPAQWRSAPRAPCRYVGI